MKLSHCPICQSPITQPKKQGRPRVTCGHTPCVKTWRSGKRESIGYAISEFTQGRGAE